MTGKTAVVDLDGVLFAGDTFAVLALHRYWRSPRRALRVIASAPWLTWAWRHEHQRPEVLQHLAGHAVVGMTPARYRSLAREIGSQLARGDRVLHDGVAAVRALLARDWRVVVATASEYHLAAAYLRGIGLNAVELVASRIDPGAGRFHVHNHGAEKARQLELAGSGTQWARAYTDSRNDLPLLRRAARPILVNPSRRLLRETIAALDTTPDVVRWEANGASATDFLLSKE